MSNKPCSCGSGKKYKKCCKDKQPRTTSLFIDMGIPKVVNGLNIGEEIELLHNKTILSPQKAYHTTSYKRKEEKKGPKYINMIPLDPKKLVIGHINILKDNFDLIFAIDTDTQTINEQTISISSIAICLFNKQECYIQYAITNHMGFKGIKQKAENIAWVEFIRGITNNPDYNTESRVGIIVDSDLGNIPAFNEQQLPIYDNFYLPKNMKLIYASFDSGREEFLENKLILLCSKENKKIFQDMVGNNMLDDKLVPVVNAPYTHFGFWD